MGSGTLGANTTADENTAFGSNCLAALTTGTQNTVVGHDVMEGSNSSRNTGVGWEVLKALSTGDDNTAVGNNAMRATTTGSDNTAVGESAMSAHTTGERNVCVGHTAGGNITTGSDNVALGRGALPALTTGNGNVSLGDTNAIGTRLFNVTTESDRLLVGHHNVTNAYVKVDWTITSDERDKVDFGTVPHGLDFVKQLMPKSYWMRKQRGSDEKSGPQHYGFVAQDIKALEGDNPVIIDDEESDHLKYKGEHLVPVLVNAIKELSAKNEALEARLAALESK